MACKGIGIRHEVLGRYITTTGHKHCQVCELSVLQDELFCSCRRYRLRTRSRSLMFKVKVKLRIEINDKRSKK